MTRKSLDGIDVASDPSFSRPIKVASIEGRLDPGLARELGLDTGEFYCPVCGMLHWTADDSAWCCNEDPPFVNQEREEAIGRMPKRGGDAFAGVLWPDELAGAIGHLMDVHQCRTTIALAHCTGLSVIFTERSLAGTVAWIGHKNWNILMSELDHDVPGCEIHPFSGT